MQNAIIVACAEIWAARTTLAYHLREGESANGLRAKLEQMCERAKTHGNGELARCINLLLKSLAEVLKDERWNELRKADRRALAKAFKSALDAATLMDAAHNIEERVLRAQNGKVLDVPLIRGDLRAAQQDIDKAFETGVVPKRGFVYVAWRKTPECFIYVGKANSAGRLNLHTHGRLAVAATGDATILSLLFPTQSKEDILFGVEASVIELVRHHTGKRPESNKRPERKNIPQGSGRQRLEDLATFLINTGRDLEDGGRLLA